MERITIVLREGLGLNFEAMRPSLQLGAAVAIGRGGAVIASVAEGDAIEDKHQANEAAAGYIDSVERYVDSANNLESVVVGLESALLGIESCAKAGQSEPWEALRRIQAITAAFLDHSGAREQIHPHAPALKPSIFDVITGTVGAISGDGSGEKLPPVDEHNAQIERVAADLREHGPDRVLLKPCGFCGGPPVVFIMPADKGFSAAPRLDSYGDSGLAIEAHVFCHECGAQGPTIEEDIFDAADYDQALAESVRLWQDRDQRNSDLYEAGMDEGLNLFPRPVQEVVHE